MRRAVLCVSNPHDYIPRLNEYSIMILNPNATESRNRYLLENSDWSLLITDTEEKFRDGAEYHNERVLWYTSGTTGDSKFCSFSQEQLDHMAKTICDVYKLSPNDRYVSVMNLWHAHGQGFYWATQLAGCETNYLTAKELRKLPDYAPTFVTAIPDILGAISNMDLQDLRFIRSASAPLSDSLYNKLKDKYSVPVIEAFGMTEAMSHCFTNPLYGEQRIGTVGLPSGVNARVVDNCLHICGPTTNNQWFDTGDLAEQDSAGYYRILGRAVDQINVRGLKLNPGSLEKQLLENIPGLEQCAVFGNSSVNCVYVGTCTADAITDFLKTLGNHCRPALVEAVDAIPLNATGKVSRSLLKSIYNTN
jgi:long-chain acyl-CoA synthetase